LPIIRLKADPTPAAGDFEGSSLERAVNKKVKTQHGRPLTSDFLKNSVEELGFKARLSFPPAHLAPCTPHSISR